MVAPDQRHGPIYSLLRFPLLVVILLVVALELLAYAVVRGFVVSLEYTSRRNRAENRLLSTACERSFEEWHAAAARVDELEGLDAASGVGLDRGLLEQLTQDLREAVPAALAAAGHARRDAADALVRLLKSACQPNLAGRDKEEVYARTNTGRNAVVEELSVEAVRGLRALRDSLSLPAAEKREAVRMLRRTYGRSALCLSGGAANGWYHFGVAKALLDHDALPRVISGSSCGALVAAMICCRTDEELRRDLAPDLADILTACNESWYTRLARLIRKGFMFEPCDFSDKQRVALGGHYTFLEAFERTGRVLCVSVYNGSGHSCLLNYVNAPDVLVHTAVMASAAVPCLLPPQELLVKLPDGSVEPDHSLGRLWKDGSFQTDVPLDTLHKLFDVHFSIVSQVEPHIIPFFFDHRGSAGAPTRHRRGQGWRGGFISAYLERLIKLDMKKWLIVMRDFDLLPKILGTDFSHLFLQSHSGVVTVTPPVVVGDYFRLLSDPTTHERMQYYLDVGAHRTFSKLSMIRNHARLERELEEIWTELGGDANDVGTHTPADTLRRLVPPKPSAWRRDGTHSA